MDGIIRQLSEGIYVDVTMHRSCLNLKPEPRLQQQHIFSNVGRPEQSCTFVYVEYHRVFSRMYYSLHVCLLAETSLSSVYALPLLNSIMCHQLKKCKEITLQKKQCKKGKVFIQR